MVEWRGGGGGGGLSYCTAKTASLMKEVLFSLDIRRNYATKSTLPECVKRFCFGCIKALFSSLPGVSEGCQLTEAISLRGGGGCNRCKISCT